MFRLKYIKYKTKYLKLQQQHGGVGEKDEGGATKTYKRLQLKPRTKATPVHLLHPKDTPLMKLLFTDGFSQTMSTPLIREGLRRLDELFIDNKKVSEIIDRLKTIDKSGIDEIVSTIKKMQESLNKPENQYYPEKNRVKTYLLFLLDRDAGEDWIGHGDGDDQQLGLNLGIHPDGTPSHLLHPKDTPLMKLLFTDGFNPEMSIIQIKEGLIRLYDLFVDREKVSEVIHQLTIIDIPDIDEIISTIEKMQEYLDKMEKICYPEKDNVNKYLLRLYQEKRIEHANK